MSEQLTRAERIARGEAATRLIAEVGKHMMAVEQKYIDEWRQPKTTPETREALWVKMQALGDIVREIGSQMADAKIARTEQEYEDNGN